MNLIISVIVSLEISLFIAAFFTFFRKNGYKFTEAVSSGIITMLIALSFIIQCSFLLGLPVLSLIIESISAALAISVITKQWKYLAQGMQTVKSFFAVHPIVLSVLFAAVGYLFAQALLLPEGNYDSMRYNLARVLLFQQEKTLFLKNVTEFHQSVLPVGGDILSHLFLRFHTDYGVAIFSFLAYLSIGLGTYSLSRSFASPPVSLTSAVVVLSLPLIVHQATGTKPDIIGSAAAVFCLLMISRIMISPEIRDLLLLIMGLCFGVSTKTTFLAFAVPFILFYGYLIIRGNGIKFWIKMLSGNWKIIAFTVIPALVLSQIWLFVYNYVNWGHWSGPPDFVQVHHNKDGLWGAAANMTRYLFQSAHMLTPVDLMFKKIAGFKLSDGITQAYFALIYPVFKDAGAAWSNNVVPFVMSYVTWGDNENGSWFGPFGFFLIIPSIFYTLLRGTAYLRALCLILLFYTFIISWQIAWMPWNCRFFSIIFVCSGTVLAFFIEKIFHKSPIIKFIQGLALIILIYSLAFNIQKPLTYSLSLRVDEMLNNIFKVNIWTETNWGQNRHYYVKRYFGDDRVKEFAELIAPSARIGIVSYNLGWIYPYLLSRPDVQFIPFLTPEIGADFDWKKDLSGFDYLLCINTNCSPIADREQALPVWQAQNVKNVKKGALFCLTPLCR